MYGNNEDLFADGEDYLTADDQINGQSNPYAWIDEYQDLVDIENLRMSTSLDAKISNSLTFRTRIGTHTEIHTDKCISLATTTEAGKAMVKVINLLEKMRVLCWTI